MRIAIENQSFLDSKALSNWLRAATGEKLISIEAKQSCLEILDEFFFKWILISGGRQPRKKHHPKFQKMIFQKCVQKFQNVNVELS